MEGPIKNKLKEIFDKHDENKLAAKKAQEKIKTEKDVFLEDFERTITNTIRPSLEEIGAIIAARGHGCKISAQRETETKHDGFQNAHIKMIIYTDAHQARRGPDHEYPSISFIATPSNKTILVHGSTIMSGHGGDAGKRGEYQLDKITQEIVETETVNLLNECFNK